MAPSASGWWLKAAVVSRAVARTYVDAVKGVSGKSRAVVVDATLTARPTELVLPLDGLAGGEDWERGQLEGRWAREHHEAALELVVSTQPPAVGGARRRALAELLRWPPATRPPRC